MKSKLAIYLTLTIIAVWTVKLIFIPITVAAIYSEEYMGLIIKCDQAMNTSWYTNQTEEHSLHPSEVAQLLHCHDYDKTRKILLLSGLPEEYLSYLGLVALEVHQRPAEEMVELHRFRER